MFGVTGFGASPITVPCSRFPAAAFVLSLAAALDLGSAAALGVHTKKQADVHELAGCWRRSRIIGLALGVTLLVSLRAMPRSSPRVFVCGYALYIMVHRGPRRPSGERGQRRRVYSAACSAHCSVSAVLPTSSTSPGAFRPYGATRDDLADGRPQRGAARRCIRHRGLFTGRDLWLAIGVLLPVAWAGVWTGSRVQRCVAPAKVRRYRRAVLLFSGVSLIARAL